LSQHAALSGLSGVEPREVCMRKIMIVGGGYAGFSTAWGLEKRLRSGQQPGRGGDTGARERHLRVQTRRHQGLSGVADAPGYHVLAVPSRERKIRVLAVWLTAALFGRDLVSLAAFQHPREAFVKGGEAEHYDENQLNHLGI
jgi:glycine/D-amino acid oxidase-like deaminating enzyme